MDASIALVPEALASLELFLGLSPAALELFLGLSPAALDE